MFVLFDIWKTRIFGAYPHYNQQKTLEFLMHAVLWLAGKNERQLWSGNTMWARVKHLNTFESSLWYPVIPGRNCLSIQSFCNISLLVNPWIDLHVWVKLISLPSIWSYFKFPGSLWNSFVFSYLRASKNLSWGELIKAKFQCF